LIVLTKNPESYEPIVGACFPSADSGRDIEGDPGLEQRTGSFVEHVRGTDTDVNVRMDVDLVGNVPGIEGSKKADTN
jgi:hypothetical protein